MGRKKDILAVYERISSCKQEYRSQHAVILRWLKDHDYDPKGCNVLWYRERKSARKQSRPVIDQLSDDVASGRLGIKGICFYSVDRFSRCLVSGLSQVDSLAKSGCRLIFIADNLDLTGWMTDIVLKIAVALRLGFAEQERQRLSQRAKASIEHRRQHGLPVGGKPHKSKRNKLIRWQDKGIPVAVQAQRLGITRQAIYQMRKRILQETAA